MNTSYLGCANIYTMHNMEVDVARLRECKSLIKKHVSVINNFRSYGFSTIASLIAVTDDPEQTLVNGLQMYTLLKEFFFTSDYLPFASMIIGQSADPADFPALAAKTRSLYNRMKGEHFFRTSAEDCGLCALMALSDKPEDTLVANAEACFDTLKPEFFSGKAVQSLSYVLGLADIDPKLACEKTMQMYGILKDRGYKYGSFFELPTLGSLALSDADYNQIADKMIEIDMWLSKQKGFAARRQPKSRLMYAGTLAQKDLMDSNSLQESSTIAAMSLVIAQMMAVYAAVCASIVASNIASATR